MLDPKLLRHDINDVAEKLKKKGFDLDIELFKKLEADRHSLQSETQELQSQRNAKSREFGQLKSKGESVDGLKQELTDIGDKLKINSEKLHECMTRLDDFYAVIPNIPADDVPFGNNEDDNVEIRKWGEIPEFGYKPRDHIEIGELHQKMDFESASKITGSRFVILNKDFARLHRAIIQFMLDVQTEKHGYEETYVPYIVNEASLFGTCQLPKFKDDQFNIDCEHKYSLIPTAEVPLTNIVRDEIIEDENLPMKFVAHTPCFRSEAGSYGKDTRGMIRQHQFEKVELVQIVRPNESESAHEELTGHAEKILQMLKLPYRVTVLCGGDLGFGSSKTYDLEVWLPGQNKYREISSCSNFKDFQARRMKARWRNPETKKPELVHTLNGSGLAAGRTLIAVLENYQQQDGSIIVPEVLVPYMKKDIINR